MSKKNEEDLIDLMKQDNTYPNPEDPEFLSKIYQKREFHYHRQKPRDELKEYKDIKEERDKICGRKFAPYDHQALIANYINPHTPYKGLLVCHGTGTGKCLLGDTLVNINNKYTEIQNIWNEYESRSLVINDGEGEWINLMKEMYVNSINKNKIQSVQKVNRLYRQKICEIIKIIKLDNGITIKTTQSHKFLTNNGWESDLSNSKYICIPKKPNFIDLSNKCKIYLDDTSIENLNNVLSSKNNIKKFVNHNKKKDIIKCQNKSELITIQYIFSLRGYYTVISEEECTIKLHDNIVMIDNDCLLCPIISVEYEHFEGYVYDLEIENIHSFIANNTYVSNTCLSIGLAEQFKDIVQKYDTKIYVLTSGTLLKEQWKAGLLFCTGETYLKQSDATQYVSNNEKEKIKKNAIMTALQYYRFMNYRSFYKKVLGDKIADKVQVTGNKQKKVYKKDKEGKFERDIAQDRIFDLNNSLLIVDEAHNLTDNNYGEAVRVIIENSVNLKVLLLTATPMKNLASDIIELINFIRPKDKPMERDKIFTSHKIHQMELKPNGLEYFKQMAKGYVSYYRGADPLTFAERVEIGEIPKGLLFTKLIRCRMLDFQQKLYDQVVSNPDNLVDFNEENDENIEADALDRKSEAVANFAFPRLSDDRKTIVGDFGTNGIIKIKNQIKTDGELLNKKIANELFNLDYSDLKYDMIELSENQKSISGLILKKEYLKLFSVKFYKALKKISRLVYQKKGARTAFVYSNLVKVGIELFQEILLENGYLEYNENQSNYKIINETICYYCGKTYFEHKQNKLKQALLSRNVNETKTNKPTIDNTSDSSSEYEYKNKTVNIPEHDFYPATFVVITGKTTEDSSDNVPEEKQKILDYVFSNISNKEGKYIKLVLGSKVMNEGINLKNVAEVHVLDVHYNLGKIDQVIGRGIRGCSHYGIINDNMRFPKVKIYKYAIMVKNGLSSEEELYQKAEKKYLLVKKIERAIKEIAFDCPINRHANLFPEEITKYKNCVEPGQPNPNNEEICPNICGYTKCEFKCDELALNQKFYDEVEKKYKKLNKNELDYSTFSHILMRAEIENVKIKIKELYKIRFDYTIEDIIEYIRNSYDIEKRELFEEFFVYQALTEMIPTTENEFNNFKDTVFNKYNQPGYLINVNKYYIFQPFTHNQYVPMYYRINYDKQASNLLTLQDYIKNNDKILNKIKSNKKDIDNESIDKMLPSGNVSYNFEDGEEYYYNRKENKYIGIIDKESNRKKIKQVDIFEDVFKIREKRKKILEKKREIGLPSIKGAVCVTAKDKDYLENVIKHLNIKTDKNKSKSNMCSLINEKLLFLEKYSTTKDGNKKTYLIIPVDHPKYKFPLNLEDRTEDIINKIKDKIKFKLDIQINNIPKKIDNQNVLEYEIIINHNDNLNEFETFLTSLGAKKVNKKWIIEIN